MISAEQEKQARAVSSLTKDAVKFMAWRGKVDGEEILSIRGDQVAIDHILGDPAHSVEYRFYHPLPDREVTVLVKDIESRPIHPFVLEQPTKENDYTFRLYISDRYGGYGWCHVELYFVDKKPGQLGLAAPWQ